MELFFPAKCQSPIASKAVQILASTDALAKMRDVIRTALVANERSLIARAKWMTKMDFHSRFE